MSVKGQSNGGASPTGPDEAARADRSTGGGPLARVLTFIGIVLSGICGGLIGYSVTELQCDDGCTLLAGLVGLAGAAFAAGGVAVVATLTLRAMHEWEDQQRPRDQRS